jgi:alpha-galactosidase
VGGAGFRPLADFVHSLGLKFGIHILRGIPKQAVARNLPIAGSPFHAADAGNSSGTCPWNPDNYHVDPSKPAAQAYYDSIATLYAGWGVDFVKADCISSRPYMGDDIRMLSQALRKTGREIALSLSPGAAPLEKVEEMRLYAQSWRISDDIWDLWHSTVDYPQGLGDQFPRTAKWAGVAQPGHWPDADMLPLGYLGPAPGWGQARQARFTREEQKTLLTLWCIFRSPLMMGGDLPSNNAWTSSLLTNAEVIAVDQKSNGNHPVISNDKVAVWIAEDGSGSGESQYLAAFNLQENAATLQYAWKDLTLTGASYRMRDLWEPKELRSAESLRVTLPSHGAVLYRITAVAGK